MAVHVLAPFSRPANLPALISILEPAGVRWHLIGSPPGSGDEALPQWITVYNCQPVQGWDACYWKLNWWIRTFHAAIDPAARYCFLCDDDGFQPGFFDAIRAAGTAPVVCTSMHRGDCRPPGSPHLATTLNAGSNRDCMRPGRVGLQQISVMGEVLQSMQFENSSRADGIMAQWLAAHYPVTFLPDVFVWFNWLEPGRWKRPAGPTACVGSESHHDTLRLEETCRNRPAETIQPRAGREGMIVTMIPYCPSKHGANLGLACNELMERLGEDDWACFIDHDACFTTRQWYLQLEAITQGLVEPAVLTAKTNRVGSPWQLVPGVDPDNHSMKYHRAVGDRILRQFGLKLRTIADADGCMSGVVILISKKTWRLLGGFRDGFLGVDTELHRAAQANGVKVYLMEGVYVYHWYRADTDGRPAVARNLSELLPQVEEETRTAYQEAGSLVITGRYDEARDRYREMESSASDARRKAMIQNDLAAISAAEGNLEAAVAGFQAALSLDGDFATARENLELLTAQEPVLQAAAPPKTDPAPGNNTGKRSSRGKVAVLSFLFNWPSTGGGIVHTVELVQALQRDGFDAKHFFLKDSEGMVGNVQSPLPIRSEAIPLAQGRCTIADIQGAFRRAVAQFNPDSVIITDCWNFKPHLAEAVRNYPYFLRFQAIECLCPLNNLRLLVGPRGEVQQCPRTQLAAPEACANCLEVHSARSGGLHQWERSLSGVGTAEYRAALHRALADAAAVLVLNPLVAEMVRPYAGRVEVVTWGMDPGRFPWPQPEPPVGGKSRKTLLMAGMIPELIKGFHVLHDACALLWRKRQDFVLLATGEPVGQLDEFTRLIGWQSQADLPRCIRAADILVMPTIAQEGLGRTTVEAMAVGRPVIASRIGGLPYTVTDGLTGLLFEPGDAVDLAVKIERLLDDPTLRARMGEAGRKRFESDFTWGTIVERHYRPLLEGVSRHRPLTPCPSPATGEGSVETTLAKKLSQ